MERHAICTKIVDYDKMVYLEYKIGRNMYTLAVSKYDDDYNIVKTLSVGDKFVIETRNVELKSTEKFEIVDGVYPLTFITKKITR